MAFEEERDCGVLEIISHKNPHAKSRMHTKIRKKSSNYCMLDYYPEIPIKRENSSIKTLLSLHQLDGIILDMIQ